MRSEPAVLGSGLLQLLQRIPDPRGRLGQRHDFVAMLATVVCAMLCGHGGFEGIAQWIHAFDEHLWHRLGYRRRPPSANCFRDLLNVLDPVAVELALWNWVESLGIEFPADGLQARSNCSAWSTTPFAMARGRSQLTMRLPVWIAVR